MELDNPLLQLFNIFSTDSVFVTLLRSAVERASCGVHNVAWHWRGPHLLNTVVLAVADGLFGLCGSQRADEYHVFRFSPLSPVPNKPYGFSRRYAPCLLTFRHSGAV